MDLEGEAHSVTVKSLVRRPMMVLSGAYLAGRKRVPKPARVPKTEERPRSLAELVLERRAERDWGRDVIAIGRGEYHRWRA